jgi:hypothetical protein
MSRSEQEDIFELGIESAASNWLVLAETDVNADWPRPARKVRSPRVTLRFAPQFFLDCMSGLLKVRSVLP